MTKSRSNAPLFSLAQVARRHPDRPALITEQSTITYREYLQRVISAVGQLQRSGVQPGERVAVLAANSPEYVILLMALWHRKAVSVPLSTRWPAYRIARTLKHIGCHILVVDESNAPLATTLPVTVWSLEELLSPGAEPTLPDALPSLELSADATMIFTSGSSGEPKAVLHTLGNHYYSARGSNRNIPFGSGDRWLLSLPLYHVGGLAIPLRSVLGGGAVVFPDPERSLEENITRLQATHLSLVSTQLYRLVHQSGSVEALQKTRAILLGGSAFSPALIEEAWKLNLPIHTSYGSTEMASQITTTPPGAPLDRLLTSGRPLPYREVRIAPDGEIQVRGATLFRGYWRDDALDPARTPDGWFPTGDLGELDEQGYLIVHGRRDNRFISGGENIQPEEIERVLLQMPDVEQAIVVPVDDPEFGQRPHAFLKLRPGASPNETQIREFLARQLPRFMIPERFYPWPEASLPPGLKPGRKVLQQIARQNRTR